MTFDGVSAFCGNRGYGRARFVVLLSLRMHGLGVFLAGDIQCLLFYQVRRTSGYDAFVQFMVEMLGKK